MAKYFWCENCQKETPHEFLGWGQNNGVMREWYACQVEDCYTEKVLDIGSQIHKGIFIQETSGKK